MAAKTYTFETILIEDTSYLYPLQYYVPDDITADIKALKIKRMLVSINGHESFAGSLISGGDQSYYIKVNKTQVKRMKLAIGANAKIILTPDESKYGMPLPEEFSAIWSMDPEADQYFHALTPGKQRNLIYMVNSVKSLDIKARKAMIIMEHLKINDGTLDFKVLNEAMKYKN